MCIRDSLSAQGEFHPDLVVLSGLRPGPEAIGAQVALDAGIAVVAVLPWPDPQATLRSADRSAFAELLGRVGDQGRPGSKAPPRAARRRPKLGQPGGWPGPGGDRGRTALSLQHHLTPSTGR